jgi:hypothetical protein
VKTAAHDGYKPFFPSGKIGEEIHYTNYRYRRKEQQHIDYSRPGSILYKRTPEGLNAVGVMYTAPADATPQQLNAIAPLSIATWHRHVDFCGGPKTLPAGEWKAMQQVSARTLRRRRKPMPQFAKKGMATHEGSSVQAIHSRVRRLDTALQLVCGAGRCRLLACATPAFPWLTVCRDLPCTLASARRVDAPLQTPRPA